MTYPRVEIDLNKIEYNTKAIHNKCRDFNVEIAGVTKVFCGHPEIAKAMVDGGAYILADSRVENLKKLKDFDVDKLLLRLPMISEVSEVVKYADISLNSELETIKKLSKMAIENNVIHKIILMVDLGDLREGIFIEDEIFTVVGEIVKLKGVKLIGLGTNLTCYGGVIPRKENLKKLREIKNKIEESYNIELEILSGGNSSSIHLLETSQIPTGINQLRIGEAIVLGRETAFGNLIDDLHDDCFILTTEIIELKEKPSIPIGEIGMDAFGNEPSFIDKGIRKRGICAIGKQDVDISDIIPLDINITIFGGSSDHLIIDLTDSLSNYKVGDKVSFKLSYGGILSTMTSPYVHKVLINKKHSK